MFALILAFIFVRPFLSSLAFPQTDSIYNTIFISLILCWVSYNKLLSKRNRLSKLKYPLSLFLLAIFSSSLLSNNITKGIFEACKYFSGLLLFLAAALANNKERRCIINTLIASALCISLMAIYQYLFGFQQTLNYLINKEINNPVLIEYLTRKRAFLPFISPNALANYLAVAIMVALAFNKNRLYIISLTLALILTKSLTGLCGILPGLILYFYLCGKTGREMMVLLSGLFAAVFITLFIRSVDQPRHFQPLFSAMMRYDYWQETLRIIIASPVVGIGLGNLGLSKTRYAHNFILQLWAETGIIGAISFLWLIFTIYTLNAKIPRTRETSGLIAGTFVFLSHNLLDFGFSLPEVNYLLWLLLGCLLAIYSEAGSLLIPCPGNLCRD